MYAEEESRHTAAEDHEGRRRDASGHDVRPVPGSRGGMPAGMENYIVALKEDEPAPGEETRGRGDLYESGVARTATFRQRLEEWLQEEHLDSEVAGIGEPTVFPLVSLTTTPEVAASIEELPEVDYVVPDSDDVGIVR